MLETRKVPGCASFVPLGVMFVLALFGLRVLGDLGEAEADYRRDYLERVPMLQWAAFINEMRLREPGLTLDEIIKMPTSFPIPPRVTCRVLALEERVDNLSDCHFIIECPRPMPFTVLSNGHTFHGIVEREPGGREKDAPSPGSTGPSSAKTNR